MKNKPRKPIKYKSAKKPRRDWKETKRDKHSVSQPE
jgi:hypothetical protein